MRPSKLLILTLAFTCGAHAAFTENTRRYISPKDIFNLWTQKFPLLSDVKKTHQLAKTCWSIGTDNVNVIGAVNPSVGKPSSELPAPGFVRWLGSCTEDILNAQFADFKVQPTNEKLWAQFWPAPILNKFRDKANATEPYHLLLESKWADLSPEAKSSLIRQAIENLIGPEPVLIDLGFVKSLSELSTLLASSVITDTSPTVSEGLRQIYMAVALREEFLTY